MNLFAFFSVCKSSLSLIVEINQHPRTSITLRRSRQNKGKPDFRSVCLTSVSLHKLLKCLYSNLQHAYRHVKQIAKRSRRIHFSHGVFTSTFFGQMTTFTKYISKDVCTVITDHHTHTSYFVLNTPICTDSEICTTDFGFF